MRWSSRPIAGSSKTNDIPNHSDDGRSSLIQPMPSSVTNMASLTQSIEEDEIDSNMSSVADTRGLTRQILGSSGLGDGDVVNDENQNDVDHIDNDSYGDQYEEGSNILTGQPIIEERQNYPNAETESESIPRLSNRQNKQRSSSPNTASNKVGNADQEINSLASNVRKKKSISNPINSNTAASESTPSSLPSMFTSSSGSFLTHAQNVEIDSLKNDQDVVPLSKSASDPGARLSETVSPSVTSAHINISNNLPISSCMDNSGNHQYNHDSLINSSISSSSAAIAPSIPAASSPPSSSSSSTSATVAAAVIEDDDPGLDHALPPDECAGSLTPSNVWRPQNQQSTCEFTHTIKQYSQKRESGCKKAEYSATTVDVHGNRWRLIVYVNGNGRASNHHLSLFLQVADADELPFGWKKAVSYVLTLEHPSGTNLGYAKRNPDKTFKLCPKAIDWGWSQFITSDRIQQEGYVHNDSLIVRASVTVKSSSVSIDVDDAELYLKCAVEEGNADAVKACLAQGAGVNCQFKDDLYTPLHTACSSSTSTGSLEVLKLLLERGADGNACNKWRETPLLIAANNGHRAAVEALLDHGADPSLCSEAGWSALTFAAHKGYDDIVSLLLTAGAPVNCKVTEDLSTPLHKACAGGKPGHLSAVRQLLHGGADVHALNKWRETPLLTAANHGQAAAVESLLRSGGDPCKCTDTGWSPLSIAAYKGHDDVVRLLLEEGAPTEEADPTLSALLQAATKGLPDTVELLLRHGADHTVTTKKGDTALSILVEQNLIDAAVEMVTEYKASVPRCSRDRKKVQRARLLINLRVKQQQKEGLINGGYNNDGNTESDDSEQDESDDSAKLALHSPLDSPISDRLESSKKKKKKKTKPKTRESAEADAKAAEEALLLELEKEDAKAQKEEAAATSKRAKKKKKRERERQQRLEEERQKEEKLKLEMQLREAEEQKKLQRQKEKETQEKLKKEREELELQLLRKKQAEQQERMQRRFREKQEKEKKEAAKRKEMLGMAKKQQLIEQQKEKEEKNKQGRDTKGKPTFSNVTERPDVKPVKHDFLQDKSQANQPEFAPIKKIEPPKPKNTHSKTSPVKNLSPPDSTVTNDMKFNKNATSKNTYSVQSFSPQPLPSNNRGWENKPLLRNQQISKPEFIPSENFISSSKGEHYGHIPHQSFNEQTTATYSNPGVVLSVEDELENMANGVVDFLEFDSPPQNVDISHNIATLNKVGDPLYHYFSNVPVELPSVSIFQEEKVAELLKRSSEMSIIGDTILRSVIYRYMIRAAHSTSDYLDPIIPSWTDNSFLITFLQRQLISENRKAGVSPGGSGIVKMELLKEAGSALAELCITLAKDVSRFRIKCIEQVPRDWSDDMVGVRGERIMTNGHGSIIVLDWSGSRQISLSSEVFDALHHRYCGPDNQFLTAIFTAAKRYETRRLIAGLNADLHLTSKTMASLYREINVSIEVWANPLSVFGNNTFLGAFPDVDASFRGLLPFGKEGGGGEFYLLENGGSVAMLPPLESATAELYVRTVLDVLERSESSNVPLSFAIFLPYECFRELSAQPTIGDLHRLDARLGDRNNKYVVHAEALNKGQHLFYVGDREEINHMGSIFVLLQNNEGKQQFPVSDRSIANILGSLRPNYRHVTNEANTNTTPVSFTDLSRNSVNGDPHHIEGHDIFSNAYNTAISRNQYEHFFEMENSREDGLIQNVDTVTGMYGNLNMSVFQNNHHNVNIENISLLGTSRSNLRGRSKGGRGRLDCFSDIA